MKILRVYGDDYSALDFERSKLTIEDGVKSAEEGFGDMVIDFYAEFQTYDFGDVDFEFIKFIKNELMDYDNSKSDNFYIVNEEI